MNYLLGDHLGSQAITTDANGSKISEVRYYPWGGDRYYAYTSSTTFRFTSETMQTLQASQRTEFGLGLYYYGARYYDKDLVHARIRDAGKRVGVKVYPHRLRHTTATQLLNVGCPVTSIQKFLGHKKLNTTMVYAYAHDKTVEEDYFTAMSRIEQRMQLVDQPVKVNLPVSIPERKHLLTLAEQLFAPDLSHELRLEIASQMRGLLVGQSEWIPPPVLKEAEVTLL